MGNLEQALSSTWVESHPRQSGEEILGIHAGLKRAPLSPFVLKASKPCLSGVSYRNGFKIH